MVIVRTSNRKGSVDRWFGPFNSTPEADDVLIAAGWKWDFSGGFELHLGRGQVLYARISFYSSTPMGAILEPVEALPRAMAA